MAKRLLNLCVDVRSTPVELTLQPNGGGDGTYYFQVYDRLDKPPTAPPPTPGQRVTLDRAGGYRVVAWDASPPVPDPAVFREPTWVDPEMAYALGGPGTAFVVSASENDPWPPD